MSNKLTKAKIARAVNDLLLLPITKPFSKSPCNIIVGVVLDTITEALLREEKVVIPGFGTFKVVTSKPKKQLLTYFYGGRGSYSEVVDIPARKRVVFVPGRTLVRYMKENVDEQV